MSKEDKDVFISGKQYTALKAFLFCYKTLNYPRLISRDMTACMTNLQEKITAFVQERDWGQFHNPKDIALSITIEAAELLELFQWKDETEITELAKKSEFKQNVQQEVADIMIYLLILTGTLGIDIPQAVMEKIEMNKKRYPVEKAKGKATKYNNL